ncbi:SH3 domain-containing protein [Jannaschia aquimarina]|uniref:Bacterial SH3 domain protein n=1 Tax=Jannaschia aquimarina TaxID=935700 RepID=A0A0D1CJG0_9RHOB|nr:SH3 domain-containing protein [Jannaschia aquimarina]KIT14817.1 Bacterial SH3 domain protein [Jannaschia aquimarina]SNS56801.1 SH3-like domain-containing protein [Jannaschia aquimarina]
MKTVLFAALAALLPLSALADAQRGSVTNLPIPRYVSMKASEGYARRGPSSTHRIDWVFVRRHMPLRVVDEYGHWRRVQDREGAGGWMHYSLLSGNRTVIIEPEELHLRRRPAPDAPVSARLAKGVVAWLGECRDGWCAVEVEDAEGWAQQAMLWGVSPGETRE